MKVVLDFPMLFLSYWLALAINAITFHFVLNLNIHLSFLLKKSKFIYQKIIDIGDSQLIFYIVVY